MTVRELRAVLEQAEAQGMGGMPVRVDDGNADYPFAVQGTPECLLLDITTEEERVELV